MCKNEELLERKRTVEHNDRKLQSELPTILFQRGRGACPARTHHCGDSLTHMAGIELQAFKANDDFGAWQFRRRFNCVVHGGTKQGEELRFGQFADFARDGMFHRYAFLTSLRY